MDFRPRNAQAFLILRQKHLDEILIWDTDKAPPKSHNNVVLWRALPNEKNPNAVSIPNLIEANESALKSIYLSYVYELGEQKIHGRRLVDHLELRPGFSGWWLSLIAEKCNFSKSPQIDDVIRILAFTKWVGSLYPRRVTLVSANHALAESLRLWCDQSDSTFEWEAVSKSSSSLPLVRRVYAALPSPLQEIVYLLRYTLKRLPLRGVGLDQWRSTKGDITFISYFFNLIPEATNKSRFASHYWNHLPDVLLSQSQKNNWLHIYSEDVLLPYAAKAADTLHRFNQTGQGAQNHVTLDSFLRLSIAIRALRDWVLLALKAWTLTSWLRKGKGPNGYLWPLFACDWWESFFGPIAISNSLNFNLFEEAMRTLPRQRIGIYLQENQGWERALIHTWRSAGHGKLIGTPHTAVRFWDLRYFSDPRAFHREAKNAMPMPDAVALNGSAATNSYRSGVYPEGQIVQVEALRYLHLADKHFRTPLSVSSDHPLELLVLGDYLNSNTKKQMRFLVEAINCLPYDITITVKPHPASSVHAEDYPGLKIWIADKPIEQLLKECDVAYTSSVTAAAIDVYLTGVPVVTMLDPGQLNLSPLRDCDGVFFVNNSIELMKTLARIMTTPLKANPKQEFFTLDKDLPRWRKLLSEFEHNPLDHER